MSYIYIYIAGMYLSMISLNDQQLDGNESVWKMVLNVYKQNGGS